MGAWEKLRAVGGGRADEKKKPATVVVWIIIAAIAVLAFGSFVPQENDDAPDKADMSVAAYEKEQEERLGKILKKINGAGDVSVYISLEDGGEAVTAKNEKTAFEESEDTNGRLSEEYETEVVLAGKEPYVVKEKTPRVAGVLVVASGAANESVRVKLYEAVKALYGMPPHRIQVTY